MCQTQPQKWPPMTFNLVLPLRLQNIVVCGPKVRQPSPVQVMVLLDPSWQHTLRKLGCVTFPKWSLAGEVSS